MNFQDRFYNRLMALPERPAGEFPPEVFPQNYRVAAVLIALWPESDGHVSIALTRRTDSLPSHRGQISFPGGSMHDGEHTPEQTALREAGEELGIVPGQVRVMGRLDDAWSRFGYHVVPVVGWLEQRPDLKPDPAEVAEVLIADVETLMGPEASCMHSFYGRETQAYRWEGGYVWGLTAEILLELFLWVRGEESSRRDFRLAWMLKQVRGDV